MLIPVRCFTCNKVVGNKWNDYSNLLKEGKSELDSLKILGLNRICCRRMVLSHVDINKKLIQYS